MTPAAFDTLAADYRAAYLAKPAVRQQFQDALVRFLGLSRQSADELIFSWDDILREARRLEADAIERVNQIGTCGAECPTFSRWYHLTHDRSAHPKAIYVAKALEGRRAVAA